MGEAMEALMSRGHAHEPAQRPRRWRLRRRAHGFGRDREGSVAIEFAMLAIPFLLLLLAIMESGLSFTSQQLLASATDDVARQLRTGQIKAADLDERKLKEMICGRLRILVTDGCPGLEVDLREYTTFADAARERIRLTGDRDIDTSGFAVTPGGAQSKNMLRVFYRWPVMTDLLRKSMANLKDGKTLHFATVTWQNEPFGE